MKTVFETNQLCADVSSVCDRTFVIDAIKGMTPTKDAIDDLSLHNHGSIYTPSGMWMWFGTDAFGSLSDTDLVDLYKNVREYREFHDIEMVNETRNKSS